MSMSFQVLVWLSLMLTLMLIKSKLIFYVYLFKALLTLTARGVNVDSFPTRAYISKCGGKQNQNIESLMSMSNITFIIIYFI